MVDRPWGRVKRIEKRNDGIQEKWKNGITEGKTQCYELRVHNLSRKFIQSKVKRNIGKLKNIPKFKYSKYFRHFINFMNFILSLSTPGTADSVILSYLFQVIRDIFFDTL
jgi:hypothetical protein